MRILHTAAAAVVLMLALLAGACKDSKSYADLLNEEDQSTNNFLADQIVIQEIPADTVFVTGPNAPYYRLTDDGTLYMQVLRAGTPGNRATDDEQIYFRYTRYDLTAYRNGKLPDGEGNNITLSPCWFRYNNFQMQASYNWGPGIQRPLAYLPIDCEVNIIIKSSMGVVTENADVQPYLWRLTYERRQ